MRTRTVAALCAVAAVSTAAYAQHERELSAHEHGVSTVELAVEGSTLTLDLYAPGMDIVGFEHEATSSADKDAVEAAIVQLSRPEELFTLDDDAGCRLAEVLSHLHTGEDDHEGTHEHVADHGESVSVETASLEVEDDHAAEEHAAEEHAAEEHAAEEHAAEEHAAEEHAAEEHGGDDHAEEAEGRHSEFHARYAFDCDDPDALQTIDFTFFEVFGNAEEIEAQAVTDAGATSVELDAGNATLSLR